MDKPGYSAKGSVTARETSFRKGMVGGSSGVAGRGEAAPGRPGGRSGEEVAELVRKASSSQSVKKELEARLAGCPLCKWILEDVSVNRTFTGYPQDYARADMFPVLAKIRHLELEGIALT